MLGVLTLPEPGDVAYPRDRGKGHWVRVMESRDDFVVMMCFYPEADPPSHVRRIRLSTFTARYEVCRTLG